MTSTAPVAGTRSAAVAELFDTLESIMINYQAPAEADRQQRWAADADRITGEVARCLSTARVRIARTARHAGQRADDE